MLRWITVVSLLAPDDKECNEGGGYGTHYNNGNSNGQCNNQLDKRGATKGFCLTNGRCQGARRSGDESENYVILDNDYDSFK